MREPEHQPRIRIGELSRRTGVRAETLRAWERRYELLEPLRTEGGFRLYGPGDEKRVRAMSALIASGLSAAEAARQARDADAGAGALAAPVAGYEQDAAARLLVALRAFDEGEANLILDELLGALSLEAMLAGVVLPVLEAIGDGWERGEISIAQEHFATNVIRGRLLGLGRNWLVGTGRLALLACPPGEHHDLGMVAFGLALRARGWRIAYLGQDTPLDTVGDAASRLIPEVIVLTALTPEPFEAAVAKLAPLAGRFRVLLAGAGAERAIADRVGAELLAGDPLSAARTLAA